MTGYHDKNSKVTGLWTIIECVSLSGSSEAAGIEGTEFILTENGDVEWIVKGDCRNLPLFECHMFEVYTYQNLQCYVKRTLLRFAAYKGHVIEFRLDQPVMSEDLMLLTYDGWFMLQCEKSPLPTAVPENKFSMLPALHDEYFVDLTLTSKSGRKFPCHSIVLQAMIPSYNWLSYKPGNDSSILCGLEDEVLETVLHYIYTQALPNDLPFSTAKLCITKTDNIADLLHFREMCHICARNTYFRNKIIRIVNEVHESLKVVSQIISSAQEFVSRPSGIVRKLKEGLTPLAIGIIKVLEMCKEFEVMCTYLTNKEQKEVIGYIRSHAPSVIYEITDILKQVHAILTSFSIHSRLEFAEYLVPEIQTALHLIVYDVASLRNCLEQIIQVSSSTADSPTKTSSLVKSLENDLHLREIQKLRILQENLSSMTNSLLSKKTQFEEVETNSRNRGVARMLELLAVELPELILRLIDVAAAMDDIFDWSEFKFVLKGGTSKLHRIMEKLAKDSNILELFVQDVVERINHESFTEAVANLGFFTSKSPSEPYEDSSRDVISSSSQTPEDSSVELNTVSDTCLEAQTVSDCDKVEFVTSDISVENCDALFNGCSLYDDVESSNFVSKDDIDGFTEIPLNDNNVTKHCDNPDLSYSTATSCMNDLQKQNEEFLRLNIEIDPGTSTSFPAEADLGISPGVDGKSAAVSVPNPNWIDLDQLHGDTELPAFLQEETKKLNLLHRVCDVPPAQKSELAKALLRMLNAEHMVDLTFCIISPKEEDEQSNSSLDSSVSSSSHGESSYTVDMTRHSDNISAPTAACCSSDSLHKLMPNTCQPNKEENFNPVERDDFLVVPEKDIIAKGSLKTNYSKSISCQSTEGHVSHESSEVSSVLQRNNHQPFAKRNSSQKLSPLDNPASNFDNIMHTFSSSRQIARKLKKSFSLDPAPSSVALQHDVSCISPSASKPRMDCGGNSSTPARKLYQGCKQSLSFDTGTLTSTSGKSDFEIPSTVKNEKGCSVASDEKAGSASSGPVNEKCEVSRLSHILFNCDMSPVFQNPGGQDERYNKCGVPGVELKAHRVVIATRCEWFRRALLSGMKEAIDRHIEVPGSSVHIFKMFLHYLYTGDFNAASLATDELVDFLVLVDHYGVDSLKSLVEQQLETRVDDDTAVPLLMVAYHCNISKLKDLCLHHCALQRRYELLHQVPPDLREQLVAAILNLKKWNQLGTESEASENSSFCLIPEGVERQNRSDRDVFSSVDPLIDEELSSLLYNMQDSASSSEDGFSFPDNR